MVKRSSLSIIVMGIVLFTLVAFLPGCSGDGSKNDPSNRPVVLVEGHSITKKQLDDSLAVLLPGEEIELTEEELTDLRLSILNELIEEELLLIEAQKRGLFVEGTELDAEIELVAKSYTDEAFSEAVIPRYGSIELWKKSVRKNLLMRKVIEEVRAIEVTVSDKEVATYYKEHIDDYVVPEQVRAAMIVTVSVEEAEAILARLKEGADFAELAKELSTGGESQRGGDLGFFGRGDMPKEFEDAAFSLKKGELSKVVTSPYGFHIFKLLDKKKGTKLALGDVTDSIRERLANEKADLEYRQWMLALKKEAKIELLEAVGGDGGGKSVASIEKTASEGDGTDIDPEGETGEDAEKVEDKK